MEQNIEYFDVVNKKGTRYRVAKCVCVCGHKHFIKRKPEVAEVGSNETH